MGGRITQCLKCGGYMYGGGSCDKCDKPPAETPSEPAAPSGAAVYENDEDLLQQRAIMAALSDAFKRTPFVGHRFSLTENKTKAGKQGHDVDVYFDDTHVGAIEIKNRSYDSAYFQRHGYMISRQKLEYLWSLSKRNIEGMLAVLTSDEELFTSTMRNLIDHKQLWVKAGAEQMSRTDHGKQSRAVDDPGYIIPMQLFTKLRQ